MTSVLDLFSLPVARWFAATYAAPTPPQERGWPEIARGRNTLILAPTGSGKTLAAFLYAVNELAARQQAAGVLRGVHTVYVSPLRALAADIERNLEAPLAGIQACADAMGVPMSLPRVAVRTGDTPPADRQRMLRRPPELLITTPESLHLLLTARRSREILRTVRYVIVDEIHTLCGEKRGSFLALLLERLAAVAGQDLVRIGLSATQRPLERVAQFLGGYDAAGAPRPVTIVDCGIRKHLDLQVVAPLPDLRGRAAADGTPSVWPAIYDRLLELARAHRSTLIFANNRRAVERIAAEMNRRAGHRLVRAHHGSVSKEARREMEDDLKAGRVTALVATASLELGIDMGAIDLVCQVETPTSVASALQRVGRAGHALGARSAGRMIPKTRNDLLRMAAMARAMLRGEISQVHVPENPLDVLAQQVVAMVAAEDLQADALYARVCQADPFHRLPRASFDAVLAMVAGEYHSPAFPALRARVLWEKSAGRVTALPGALPAAIGAGGTIPDTGQYAMVLDDGATRLGELDEEFVFERRIGDTFVLGTGRWRIVDIRADRVVVTASTADEAQLPFWKGDGLGHDVEFGQRLGAFLAECAARRVAGDLVPWLQGECALDGDAARSLSEFLAEEDAAGGLPDDRTVVVEAFPNEQGDLRVAIVSTFGRSFHVALWLVLRAQLRRAGVEPPEGMVSNDGVLLRPGPLGLAAIEQALAALQDGDVRARLLEELQDSPYFALRFRRNAGRALLVPRSRPGRRVPLWLQRLQSHDLLRYASEHPRFPIVAETFREILEDALPVESLAAFLAQVAAGEARFVVRRARGPSPFTTGLVLDFVGKYLYETDRPLARAVPVDADLLGSLLHGARSAGDLVSDEAIRLMDDRLQGLAPSHRARDAAEVVDLLKRVGDLTEAELRARCEPEAAAALAELEETGRLRRITTDWLGEERLVAADDVATYRREEAGPLLRRSVRAHAGQTEDALRARYPGAPADLADLVLADGGIVRVDLPGRSGTFVDGDVLVGLRRMTASARRRESVPASLEALQAYVLRRQHVEEPLVGATAVREALAPLAGWLAPVAAWPDLLAARIEASERARIDPLVRAGALEWRGARSGGTRLLGFAPVEAAAELLPARDGDPVGLAARVAEYLTSRGASFLHHIARDLGASAVAVDETLWDLTWRSWVTNDALVAAQRAGPSRGAPAPGLGRWSVVGPSAPTDLESLWVRQTQAVVSRCGFACREVLARDPLGLRWSAAYPLLSRMEWAGELDRGLFVSGLCAPQFVDRAARDALQGPSPRGGLRLLSVLDPALLVGEGMISAGVPRRGPGNYLVVGGGRPRLAVEAYGRRLVASEELTASERREAVALLPRLVRGAGRPARVRVETWNGVPAAASEAADDLAAVGFVRDDQAMVIYRDFEAR